MKYCIAIQEILRKEVVVEADWHSKEDVQDMEEYI